MVLLVLMVVVFSYVFICDMRKPRYITCNLIYLIAEGALYVYGRTFKYDTWCFSLNNCHRFASHLTGSHPAGLPGHASSDQDVSVDTFG